MGIYYTIETFAKKISNLMPDSNITLLNYDGIKKPFSFTCNQCGKTSQYQAADKVVDRARRGLTNACKYCEDTQQLKPRLEGINKVNSILKKKTSILLLEPITRLRHTKVSWQCLKCNHFFQKSAANFLKNPSCPWCEGALPKYTIDIIRILIEDQWGTEYTLLSQDYNYNKSAKIKVRHNKCGFIYDTNAHNFVRGHGCPRCKASSGERLVRNFLVEYNLVFQEQYRFEDSEVSTLTFDFYLENNNNQKFVIEYNGLQHYEPVEFFGGLESFKGQQKRDLAKVEYCKKNGIELIIVPYNNHSILSKELAQRLNGEGA